MGPFPVLADVDVLINVGWALLFAVVGGIVGITLLLLAVWAVPLLINRLTPALDEEKEIARGNAAVAEYFGRVVSSAIIGVSIVIAAAIVAGILAGLHG